MTKAFKFRAYVNKQTEKNATEWLRLCCDLYNACIFQREDCYNRLWWGRKIRYYKGSDLEKWENIIFKVIEKNPKKAFQPKSTIYNNSFLVSRPEIMSNEQIKRGKTPKNSCYGLNKGEQNAELTRLKAEFPEYNLAGMSQTLTNVIARLDKSYKMFFNRSKYPHLNIGKPTFKYYQDYSSFTFTNTSGWKLVDRVRDDGTVIERVDLLVPSIGRFKLRGGRLLQGEIATVTVKREKTGKWFVVFSCKAVPKNRLPAVNKSVGIDVGLTSFLVDSDGRDEVNPKFFKQHEKKLRILQRHISRQEKERKKHGSKRSNRSKQSYKELSRLHARIKNLRENYVYQLVSYYVNNYDDISVEDLDIMSMVKKDRKTGKYKLSKSILDSGWGIFIEKLGSKSSETGRIFKKKAPEYTSMTCSECGYIQPMPLHQRVFICEKCNLVKDRDLNSALVIRDK
jgi:putative transposase